MSTLTINTTQNVNLSFTAASAGTRLLAFLVDMLIKAAYVFVIVYLVNFFNIGRSYYKDDWGFIGIMIILMTPVIFYTLLFETLLEGQTPGKRVMRIKVVKIDGFQASFPDHFSRWLMRIVDLLILNGIIAIVAIITSEKSQRLGDMVAGTSVITLKSKTTIDHTILMNLGNTYQPVYAQAAYLSDNDARIIKDSFERAVKSDDFELLMRLTEKLENVLSIRKSNMTDRKFIHQILEDFNYYTGAQS